MTAHTTDIQIEHCARCGQDHRFPAVAIRIMQRPIEADGITYDRWAQCPNTADPILIAIVDPVVRRKRWLQLADAVRFDLDTDDPITAHELGALCAHVEREGRYSNAPAERWTVAQHSFIVAIIAVQLAASLTNGELHADELVIDCAALLSLVHDLQEGITRDLATPAALAIGPAWFRFHDRISARMRAPFDAIVRDALDVVRAELEASDLETWGLAPVDGTPSVTLDDVWRVVHEADAAALAWETDGRVLRRRSDWPISAAAVATLQSVYIDPGVWERRRHVYPPGTLLAEIRTLQTRIARATAERRSRMLRHDTPTADEATDTRNDR